MENPYQILELTKMDIIIYGIVIFIFLLFTELTLKKIFNKKIKVIQYIFFIIIDIIISIEVANIKYYYDLGFALMLELIFMIIINIIIFKERTIYIMINTILSFSINYIIYCVSVMLCFIPMIIFDINNDYINLVLLISFYILLVFLIFKIKKIKNGIIYLQGKLENQYVNLLLINISALIIFVVNILSEYKEKFTARFLLIFIFLILIMYFTIKEFFKLYYKQNLLIQDLEDTRYELEKFRNENKKLEKENLELSKKSHSLAHKQNSLEYKLDMIMKNTEFAKELDIVDRVKNLADEVYKSPKAMYIPKTGIQNIDDIFCYMQNECVKNNIEFRLKIYGNIYQMINNFVTKEELEILIADHIKDAIIAINHCDNINRSILVKLGKINKIYSLYIYDSGIEFEIETLKMLGSKPVSTHKESGGTGLGFMNTFDTIKRRKATLIIKEYNKPCKENYTKVIIIKFNNEYEFKIDSYRNLKTLKERNEII